jgi:hypothetical protein
MPVPYIEKLGTELERDTFCYPSVFDEGKIMVVVRETPHVTDSRPLAPIKVKFVDILKGTSIE